MEFQVAQIVRSLAGRDEGGLFCVVGVEGDFLRLADGKTRKVTRPKRKRRSHAEYVGTGDHPVFRRLAQGETVGNRELRRALAAFQKGGNHAWQRTI